MLQAPSLSFDWDVKDEGDEGGLEVDLPETGKADSRRTLFREQLHRSISANQAKNLVRLERSTSNLSRGSSNQDVTSRQQPADHSKPKEERTKPKSADDGGAARRIATSIHRDADSTMQSTSVHRDADSTMQGTSEKEPGAMLADTCAAESAALPPRLEEVDKVAALEPRACLAPTAGADREADSAPPQAPSGDGLAVQTACSPCDDNPSSTFEDAPCLKEVAPATDPAHTQDWPRGVSLTAAWNDMMNQVQTGVDEPDLQDRREISPTLPCPPMFPDGLHDVIVPDISPTVPFDVEGGLRGAAAALAAPAEISPTLPFDVGLPPPAGGTPEIFDLQSGRPRCPSSDCLAKDVQNPQDIAPNGSPALEQPQPQQGTLSDDDDEDDDSSPDIQSRELAAALGEGRETAMEDEQGRQKLEEDRAWKRLQRRRLREEEGRRRQQEAKIAKEQKRAAAAHGLGVSTMRDEDASRYDHIVAHAPVAMLRGAAGTGMQALVGGRNDDAELLGGFRKVVQRPKFLLGRTAAATA